MNNIDFLSRKQIDIEAENFLQKYRPNALKKATKLDLEKLIENDLGIEIDYQNLDSDHQILGATIFKEGYMKVFNDEKEELKKFNKNSMVFDIQLSEDYKQEGRFLFTLAHEIGHWVLHRKFFYIDESQENLFDLMDNEKFIICVKREETALLDVTKKTNEDWIEWQADNFASSLLMPKDVFKFTYEKLIKSNLDEKEIVKELSRTFGASKKACEVRINILYRKNKQYNNQLLLI